MMSHSSTSRNKINIEVQKQKTKFKEFLFEFKLIRNSKKQIDEHGFGHFVFGMYLSVSTF